MPSTWDHRYRKLGASVRAVMFKSLPDILNDYLHHWQLSQIESSLQLKSETRFLDVGCGYGRIALPLAECSGAQAVGLDGSRTSIELFNTQLGAQGCGCVGDIMHLPFADESFDAVLVVTTLMYLTDRSQRLAAFQELVRVVGRGRHGVIIENNRWGGWLFALISSITSAVRALSAQSELAIPAVTLDPREIDQLFQHVAVQVSRRTGCPAFTFGLPILLLLSLFSRRIAAIALRVCQALDSALSWFYLPSLYVCYTFCKGNVEG